MKIRIFLLLLLFAPGIGSLPLKAEPLCEGFDAQPEHFQALYQKGVELGRAICARFGETIDSEELERQLDAFARAATQAAAEAFAATEFAEQMTTHMKHFESLAAAGIRKEALPSFEVFAQQSSLGRRIFFGFATLEPKGLAARNDEGCTRFGAEDCKVLLESLATAIEQYKKPYVNLSGKNLSDRAQFLQQEWDRYFEKARPQTLWDALLTTVREQDHLAQDRLVGPMQRQWFVLHPSIVIENVSAAEDGDELSEALAIEWIGINWWNGDSSPIGYPFGVSLASVYSDRVEIEEVGHGLMFHFGNSISVGWTNHDGDDGWLVTVDFLSFMARKKQNWESYKSRIETILENERKAIFDPG